MIKLLKVLSQTSQINLFSLDRFESSKTTRKIHNIGRAKFETIHQLPVGRHAPRSFRIIVHLICILEQDFHIKLINHDGVKAGI